tara:strand:- start:2205 stop:2570 length:366 start_codon:yes stop_codon:yes gene_type:complete
MVSLLLFLATAQASDVYEICMVKNQTWSERYQVFETTNTTTYYSYKPIQFIVHKKSFELNRDAYPIVKNFVEGDQQCFRNHGNSKVCLDKDNKLFYWEKNTRAGATHRDVMYICSKNGEAM